jgi:hypothetical protein
MGYIIHFSFVFNFLSGINKINNMFKKSHIPFEGDTGENSEV